MFLGDSRDTENDVAWTGHKRRSEHEGNKYFSRRGQLLLRRRTKPYNKCMLIFHHHRQQTQSSQVCAAGTLEFFS